ncbi:hypothetical protein ACIL4J_002671 [Enterococcus hirae]
MIKEYIEKDIIRKTETLKYFFYFTEINLNILEIPFTIDTFKRDFSFICNTCSKYINQIYHKGPIYRIYFKKDTEYFDVAELIYRDSIFLKLCTLKLKNIEYSYYDIADLEYISLTKAYHLKKRVNAYFENRKAIKSELYYRYSFLEILLRIEVPFNISIYDNIEIPFNIKMNKLEKRLFLGGIYLAIERHENNPIFISDKYLKFLKSSLMFLEIKRIISTIGIELDDHEIAFLSIVFRMISFNVNNYFLFEKDHLLLMNKMIETNPQIPDLLIALDINLKVNNINDTIIQSSILRFITPLFFSEQEFLLSSPIYQKNAHEIFLNKFLNITNNWIKSFSDKEFKFSKEELNRISIELISIINQKKQMIIVVSKNINIYLIYRKKIQEYLLSSNRILLDNIYYSLEDIPLQFKNNIIICDERLKNNNTIFPNIYYISYTNIDNNFKEILIDLNR